jgi:EAL domain-containing protein (putative c-di-GMP-specific phosphodiesterase class I)
VLESVALLASRIGARVVAEGVETVAALDAVRALGIELVQGYLFTRPLPAQDIRYYHLLRNSGATLPLPR